MMHQILGDSVGPVVLCGLILRMGFADTTIS